MGKFLLCRQCLIISFILMLMVSKVNASGNFVDNGDGTLTDVTSGLIWLKDGNCFGKVYDGTGSIYDGTAAYYSANIADGQCGLSDGSVAGDWHLPTLDELKTLTDAGFRSTSLNASGFTNIQSSDYWSSSLTSDNLYVYSISMSSAYVSSSSKSYVTKYLWPVRNGVSSKAGFINNGNGTITDTRTQLVWLKNANCFGKLLDGTGVQYVGTAKYYSDMLSSGQCGLADGSVAGDWHLPSLDEMTTFTNAGFLGFKLNAAGFDNVQGADYWTSSLTSNGLFVYSVSLSSAYVSSNSKNYVTKYFWPVRQALPPKTFTVSGSVTIDGVGLGGVSLTVSGAASSTILTAADGSYSFPGLADGAYSVTPERVTPVFPAVLKPSSRKLNSCPPIGISPTYRLLFCPIPPMK